MYGYEEYFDLSPEHILQKVTQEQIFKIVLKEIYIDTVCYTNPLRRDKNPGCWLSYDNTTGALLFVDFADKNRTHRNCFRMIMDKYNVSMRSALKIICNHYKLSENIIDYKEISIEDYEKLSIPKTPPIISFYQREFNKQDVKYWSQYLIFKNQLLEDGVYPIQSFIINGKKINTYGLAYAYTFPNNRVKIYQPYTNPKYKWITNCDNNIIGNYENISNKGKNLIVSKSYKDCRVLRNLGYKNVIWFQNEGQVPNDKNNIELISRFERIIFLYDNDLSGKEAGIKLASIYNSYKKDCATNLYLPNKYGHKDPSDFIKKEGTKDLIKVLNKMNLYAEDT
jgi:hypothetical protein